MKWARVVSLGTGDNGPQYEIDDADDGAGRTESGSDCARTWTGRRAMRGSRIRTTALAIIVAAVVAIAAGARWPDSSRRPVAPLSHPTVASRVAALTPEPSHGYSFVAFGDQRALLGGVSQRLFHSVDSVATHDGRLLFMVDTGDIVDNGSQSDQFGLLADALGVVRRLPYVVGVGNHEVEND